MLKLLVLALCGSQLKGKWAVGYIAGRLKLYYRRMQKPEDELSDYDTLPH